VELYALADREDVSLAVLRNGDPLGELGHRFGVLVAGVKRLVEVEHDVARDLRVGGVRVERGRCLHHGDDHVTAATLRERVPPGKPTGGERHGGESCPVLHLDLP
jgi:hypothetical protein